MTDNKTSLLRLRTTQLNLAYPILHAKAKLKALTYALHNKTLCTLQQERYRERERGRGRGEREGARGGRERGGKRADSEIW